MHGGAAPQIRAVAERAARLQEAEKAARRLGAGLVDVDPVTALLDAVREAAWNVEVYRGVLSDVAPVGMTDPSVRFISDRYDAERDRLARVSEAALRAGGEERLLQLHEAQAQLAWAAVMAGLNAVEITREQREQFTREFAAVIRANTAEK